MDNQWWHSYVSPHDLEKEIRENPITEEGLAQLVSEREITLRVLEKKTGRGIAMFGGCVSGKPKYHIIINGNDEYDMQLDTLAHELVHIFYCCAVPGHIPEADSRLLEGYIEREGLRIRKELAEVIEKIYEKLAGDPPDC